ncbi:MAG: ParA family protein [Symploca sp. SIO1C2]|nr:ParA family protein [Symploca sp. SIO1C2]
MIASDIRLYTWVDVEEVLLRMQEQGKWPEWLVWARAYWDELRMGIRPGTQELAKKLLSETYDPRFRISPEQEIADSLIILESISQSERILPVFFEETEEELPILKLIPSLSKPGVVWQQRQELQPPESFTSDFPPVVAFHSFKGGVGRTTHALALAKALTNEKYRVLLVDGDLEAPGISWVFEQRLPNPDICFADVLALAHGDPSPEAESTIQLVVDRLQSSLIDGIYILPSFRSTSGFTSLEIRPEHLIQGSKNPFLLTQLIASIGKALEVDFVLIDLRAGLSELATGLILDPRVYRIFVTTLSAQSISGTIQLLELIANRALSTREEDPLPALIFTQVPEDERANDLVKEAEDKLLEAAQPFLAEDNEPLRVVTPFTSSLLALPSTWEDVVNRLQRSGIVDAVRTLVEWLPSQQSELISASTNPPTLKSQREQLKETAEKLVYAERAEAEDFLATDSLRNLASDHRVKLPIMVIVGAKGSGKTYTFLQIIRRKDWQTFAKDACANAIKIKALICPVLASRNLAESAKKIVKEAQEAVAQELEFDHPLDASTIRDKIRETCQKGLHEGQWRERWLDVIAWGVGCQPGQEGAGRNLTADLVKNKQQLVVIIDGLEDLFQNFTNNEAQQTALRALLQEVPEWLEQQPSRPLGIIIFVRRDIVLATVHQNSAQMMARYQPYALKWSREEALRLVTWVSKQADILPSLNVEKLQEMDQEQLTQKLIPLWGKKLGSERSKQAPSAKFVIDALSDFNGQIQSRDLVRLLYIAARDSINEHRWQDRILVPKAIRESFNECGKEKIKEIKQENKVLGNVIEKLQNLKAEEKKIPFTRDETQLSQEEVKDLVNNGAAISEGDDYYLPEIFRTGLGFTFKGRGRTKVISLARRAR